MALDKRIKTVVLILLVIPLVGFAKMVKISQVTVSPIAKHTRLVFTLTGPCLYKIEDYQRSSRIVIDFRGASLATSLSKIKLSHSLVKAIHSRTVSPQTLQFILNLHRALIPKPFVQRPRGRFGYRLIVDLVPPEKVAPKIRPAPSQKEIIQPVVVTSKPKVVIQEPLNSGRPAIIVIDPGHGGKDPGTTGPDGYHEKNVVLAIGKDLEALLKKQPHIVTKMTRTGDYFVTLRGRLSLARRGHADLFMAIHADAYIDQYAQGASIFALSQRGASSEAARWLAQKENYSELGGIDLASKSYQLRSVLLDLSQAATIRESLMFGWSIVQGLHDQHILLHRGVVEQAPFVVLKSPDIPSLLIETGFMSNRQEEYHLINPQYQKRIAESLANGIVSYLKSDPPPGTWFALQRYGIKHVVKKGETLYSLSKHYGVSVAKLRAVNNMRDNTLSDGAVIRIP